MYFPLLQNLITDTYMTCFYQLKQLCPVARSLSVEAAKTLVQAFVSSQLDYCNAILRGLPEKLMRRLQSVQNAVTRMITSAWRHDHITPILRQLHWLPVDNVSTQNCRLGIPVSDRPRTCLSGRRLSARH